MSREQKLLILALPIVAGAIWFVRMEFDLSSPPKSSATQEASSNAAPAMEPSVAPAPVLFDSPATEEIPKGRTSEDEEIISHAKDAPASMLDSSLPHQSAGYWIAHAAGPSAGILWEVTNCPGARKQTDSKALCVEARVSFVNGTHFNTELIVGDKPLNPPGPIHYTPPSLLWASYKKPRGPLVPAPLNLLPRIAQESY
jgi:hypothetical protein